MSTGARAQVRAPAHSVASRRRDAPRPTALGEGVQRRSDYESDESLARRRAFRPDIQGLRAVAVTLVVLYHCGVPFLPGGYVGVDVFFVISGFLITLHLVTEVDRTGRVSVSGFYARRIRRLLPPALVVIASTILVARVWGPAYESTRTAVDGLFAAFYGMNLRLAQQGVDYQQVDAAPSPFQHFWSLAVEEQFYVVWPVLIMVVAVLTRRVRPWLRRAALLPVVAAVVGASLAASAQVTETNAPLAYYAPHTRAWELAAGALAAIVLPLLVRIPRLLAAPATWIGLAVVIWSAVSYDASTPFPGTAAVVPVAGALLVIVGGASGSPWGVVRILRNRVVQLVGHVSYGWYLWHWPALLLAPALFDQEFSLLENLEVSVLALWLAILTYLLVEQPALKLRLDLRRWLGVAAAMSGLVVATAVAAVAVAPSLEGRGPSVAALDLSKPAAAQLGRALAAGTRATTIPANLDPTLEEARGDQPATTADGCHLDFLEIEQPRCVFGDPSADRTIVLFGDSHAQQWFGAVDELGQQDGWRVVAWTKAACPVADLTLVEPNIDRPYTECATWREDRLDAIERLDPELVITSQADTLGGPGFDDAQWGAATGRTVERLVEASGRLIFLGDTPRPTVDVPACLADHPGDVGACATTATRGIAPGSDLAYLAARSGSAQRAAAVSGAMVVDPTPWLCVEETCPPIVANLLVFRDDSHLTDAYSTTLSALLRLQLPDDGSEEDDVRS